MVNWLGIEDTSTVPNRVWLVREKDVDPWMPLRKYDCEILNSNYNNKPVMIDSGRAMADPEFGIVRYNYFEAHELQLTSATWFVREDAPSASATTPAAPLAEAPTANKDSTSSTTTAGNTNNSKIHLVPLTLAETVGVEDLYQQAVHAASGIDSLLQERVSLVGAISNSTTSKGGDSSICIQKEGDCYTMRKVPNGWFGKTHDLQRGYGAYVVPGEEEEAQLGPVRHVVFVVHGIGEAMWSREDVTYAKGLIKEVTHFRMSSQRRQVAEWKKQCEVAKKESRATPSPPTRVEYIPILWYDRVRSSSSSLMTSLKTVTLGTIPALREIANDVIFDVLMYMTPNFCYEVLECVTDQIHGAFDMFKKANPEFAANDGACSLMGHSLGSVIIWDLLCVLREEKELQKKKTEIASSPSAGTHSVHITPDGLSSNTGYQHYASGQNANLAKNGTYGPSLPKPMERKLPFRPEFSLFLGSPVGLFLTLRGAHAVFDELRTANVTGKKPPSVSPFCLPTGSLHNIFHPSDPVAYRIEPLLLPLDQQIEIPAPLYLTREGEEVRLHVRAMHLGDEIRKSYEEKKQYLTSVVNQIAEQAQSIMQRLEDCNPADKEAALMDEEDTGPLRFPLAGRINRLDFQLQPRIMDNEYVSAVMAHSSYFSNTDVMDYVFDLTRVKQNVVIDLTDDAKMQAMLDTAHAL